MAREIVGRDLNGDTRQGYSRSFHQLDDLGLTPQEYARAAVGVKPLSKGRYYALKTAFQYGLAEQIVARLEEVHLLRKADDGGASDQVDHLESLILRDASLLEAQVPDYDRQRKREGLPSAHPGVQVNRKSKGSKRPYLGSLNRAFPDWQKRIFNALPKQHRALLAVVAASGCRPREVREGVAVEVDGGQLVLTINGAKTGAGYGQKIRIMRFEPKSVFEKLLYKAAMKKRLLVEQAASERAVRKAVEGAVLRALGKRWVGKVSLVSFRHQFAADLKGAGVSKVEIALAMGHCSERTQGHYGLACQKRKGRSRGLVHVEGSQPVKRRVLKPGSNESPR